MGERQITTGRDDMATTSTAVTTVPPQLQEESVERVAVITLRPTPTEPRKKVVWTEDTVDNEHMNKKKSKCCCIYEKPREFAESDSEDSDDECEHCFGHVEHKHKKRSETATEVEDPNEALPSIILKPSEEAPAPSDRPPAGNT